MSTPIYRTSRPEDTPQLFELWRQAYQGDSSCADIYLNRYYSPGSAVVAELDGQLTSAIYMLPGYWLHLPERPGRPCTYLYALGTPEQYRGRGYGGKTIWKSGVVSYERGADFVCFLPASPSLYRWYEGCIGTRSVFYRRDFSVSGQGSAARLSPLSPQEYATAREQLLSGTPHTELPLSALSLQGEYCRLYGGDLLRLQLGEQWGLAALDREGKALFLRELLFPQGDPVAAVRGLLGAMQGETAQVRSPAFWHPELGQVVQDNVLVPGGYSFPKTDLPPYWGPSMD